MGEDAGVAGEFPAGGVGAVDGEGEAAAGEGDRTRMREVLAEIAPRAAAALAEGEGLLPRARADFADDEKKQLAIEPALYEALGQVRDAAARAPALIEALEDPGSA